MAEGDRPLIWSPEARSDLSEIWDHYLTVAGQRVADSVARKIVGACVQLEERPFASRPRDEIRAGLRSITASPHVVFYRVSGEAAEIVRVLDGRRDLDDRFSVES